MCKVAFRSCNWSAGQVLIRDIVHTIRADCTDPRLTGRHTAFGDGYVQADGTIAVPGTAIDEVGTWDAAGTDFTPSAGI